MENALVFAVVIGLDMLVGLFAHGRRNRSFRNWFMVSLLFSPLVGFAIVACLKTLPEGLVAVEQPAARKSDVVSMHHV